MPPSATTSPPIGVPLWLARTGRIALVFLVVLATELVVTALAAGAAPNDASLPIIEQRFLLEALWQSNPAAALTFTLKQALLLIEHRDPETGLPIWGFYYMPITFAVHVLLAFFITRIEFRMLVRHKEIWPVALTGTGLIGLGAVYVRLASCCSSGPRWGLDLVIFARANDPLATWIDWPGLYAAIAPLLPILQGIAILGGLLLLIRLPRRVFQP